MKRTIYVPFPSTTWAPKLGRPKIRWFRSNDGRFLAVATCPDCGEEYSTFKRKGRGLSRKRAYELLKGWWSIHSHWVCKGRRK